MDNIEIGLVLFIGGMLLALVLCITSLVHHKLENTFLSKLSIKERAAIRKRKCECEARNYWR